MINVKWKRTVEASTKKTVRVVTKKATKRIKVQYLNKG